MVAAQCLDVSAKPFASDWLAGNPIAYSRDQFVWIAVIRRDRFPLSLDVVRRFQEPLPGHLVGPFGVKLEQEIERLHAFRVRLVTIEVLEPSESVGRCGGVLAYRRMVQFRPPIEAHFKRIGAAQRSDDLFPEVFLPLADATFPFVRFVIIGRQQVSKAVCRRFANDWLARTIEVEQRITLRGNRGAIERLKLLLAQGIECKILILEFEDRAGLFVRVQRIEPSADLEHASFKFIQRNSRGRCESHRIGVAKDPIQSFINEQSLRDGQHQPRSAGNQSSQERMKEISRVLALGAVCNPRARRSVDLNRILGVVGIVDIQFDENAVGSRVGQNLQRQLLGL